MKISVESIFSLQALIPHQLHICNLSPDIPLSMPHRPFNPNMPTVKLYPSNYFHFLPALLQVGLHYTIYLLINSYKFYPLNMILLFPFLPNSQPVLCMDSHHSIFTVLLCSFWYLLKHIQLCFYYISNITMSTVDENPSMPPFAGRIMCKLLMMLTEP